MAAFYVGLVDQGGEGWGITFPDLPGCFSGARSISDLFSMSIEAVRLWAEAGLENGQPLPPARSMDLLLSDPEVTKTIEEVGPISFLQVPLLLESGRPVRANVSFDAGLLVAIDAAAKQRGLTRSAFLASAARDKIAGNI